MNLQMFHQLSLSLGVLAYAVLTVFCIVTWARGITGRAAYVASLATLLFLLALALTGIGPIATSLQAVALLAWMALLARVTGIGPRSKPGPELRPLMWVLCAALAAGLCLAGYAWVLAWSDGELPVDLLFALEVLLAVAGLVMLEQVVRNTREDLRWRLRHLNIGIGTLFGFQLLHGACALLFNGYLLAMVAAQPAVYALAAPLVAVASLRNPSRPLKLNLSREFVFRSGMMITSGVLLLILGGLAFLVRLLDGNWSAATLALLVAVAGVATTTVFGSSQVRLRARRLLEDHLFARKHDHRDTWQRVTYQLTERSADFDLPQQVIRALGNVLHSPGGGIWQSTPAGALVPIGQLHSLWDMPLSPDTGRRLQAHFAAHDHILDLRKPPQSAELAAAMAEVSRLSGARFVIPLMMDTGLVAVVVLNEPLVSEPLTWEDDDVVALIARQAAGFVALRHAERELAEADKLSGMNQLSAFIVHDLKTISSQLSLMLENAPKHKGNPDFFDDMIGTVDNALGRMRKLLDHLRGETTAEGDTAELDEIVTQAVASFRYQTPVPTLQSCGTTTSVSANAGKLSSALGHLIQNAMDAANAGQRGRNPTPHVGVELRHQQPWAEVHITDNGPGMVQRFIDQVLFQPLASTKGVAGMGVGAYQARAYIRSLGGDISVYSRIGHGTTFTVRLPAGKERDES